MSRCCGTSVGILITDQQGRLLMIERGWWPVGIAPVAGHVRDAHDTVAEALAAEVSEEVGLTVVGTPELLWEGHRPNLCQSLPATPVPGHYWWLYRADTTGELAPDPDETKGAAWYTQAEVHALAERTIAHAHGHIPADAYEATPGLEAVWVAHLATLGTITATPTDLAAVERLYTTAPPEYWID